MRKVKYLYDGWKFALQKTRAGAEGEFLGNGVVEKLHFEPVFLPHDWAVSSPLNRRMEQAQEQGFYDR